MGVVIGVANVKGGVGKTSLVNAFSYEFQEKGKKVLVVDLDPQASQTTLMGIDPSSVIEDDKLLESSSYQVFKNKSPQPLKIDENIYLLPAVRLLQEEVEQNTKAGKELLLRKYIRKVKDYYDYILIDPPSSMGTIMISTIVASDYVLIPQRLTLLDETGTVELLSEMALQGEIRGEEINILGIIPVFYKVNDKTYREKLVKQKDEIKGFIESIDSVNLVNKDVFFPYVRDLAVWRKATESLMPLRKYILEKDRTYKPVLTEIGYLLSEVEEKIGEGVRL